MTTDERKKTMLPCGFTVAQSWAALRGSWLGFNIAHSDGNSARMSYYAATIRKLQRQMGIQVTKFDPGILEEQEDEDEYEEHGGESTDDITLDASTPDYDGIMDEAKKELNGERVPIRCPRAEIFAKRVQKSVSDNEKEDGSPDLVRTKDGRRACIFPLGQQEEETHSSSSNRFGAPDEGEKERRSSCTYEME